MALRFVVSHRFEALAADLAAAVDGGGDPLAEDLVVVQNRGLAVWLEQQLARRNGVAFLGNYPLPRRFLADVFARLHPGESMDPRFEPERLAWVVDRELADLGRRPLPGGGQVAAYVEGDSTGLKRIQLAAGLARTFDDYLTSRPELVLSWEEGRDWDVEGALPPPDAQWQAELWRRVVAGRANPAHLARVRRRLLARLAEPAGAAAPASGRLFIVGSATWAPVYLEVFQALAARCDVVFYRFEPLGDWIGPGREGLRPGRLASVLGRASRGFWAQAVTLGWTPEYCGAPPEQPTLLASLQRSVLGAPDLAPAVDVARDSSLRVHVCHSPLRELEVLRDSLLAAFDEGDLAPHEVLVLTPRIEEYAPLAAAVFGVEEPRIPFRVADRPRGDASRLSPAFLALLNLADGRFGAGDVLDWLSAPAVRARFQFEDGDEERLRAWRTEAPLWWGVDSGQREELGLGAAAAGSWAGAADRLMAGYALGADGDNLFEGVAPLGNLAGERAECAGKLAALTENLVWLPAHLAAPRPLAGWADVLEETFRRFFAPGRDEADAAARLRETLAGLRRVGGEEDLRQPVTLAAVREHLERTLGAADPAVGFLSGGVTVAALQPLRSVPAKFVAVLGLNDGFPRRPPTAEFDLRAQAPRPGDEVRSDDDRHLFLETLMSARRTLHLSYVGQSIRDNSELPASLVIDEVLQAAADRWGAQAARTLRVNHRLHAFSPEYFRQAGGASPDRLFSYSASALAAATASIGVPGGGTAAPFFLSALPEAAAERRAVSLDELTEFFEHPLRTFCRARLGFTLRPPGEEESDREPLSPNKLEQFKRRSELTDRLLEGGATDSLAAWWQAAGRLPAGPAGLHQAREAEEEARELERQLRPLVGGPRAEPVSVNLRLGGGAGFRLSGALTRLRPAGVVHHRPGRLRAKDRLALWIEHLAWCAQVGRPGESVLVGWNRNERKLLVERFGAEGTDAAAVLAGLLDLRWRGLHEPLPFPIETCWALVERPASDQTQAWEGGGSEDAPPGENADPHWALCFGAGWSALDSEECRALAATVFDPLRTCRREVEA